TISPKENGKQPKKDIEGYEFVETKTDEKGNTKHIYKKKENTKKAVVSTDDTSNPNTSTGTDSSGKTTVVTGSKSTNQANKKGRGKVRTGVGSSLGALVTLAGSVLALFKSKKRK
ncbi:MAG: hypothetical protein E7C95_02370, partial [Anaerococcus prevotii]|uniref:hypothetical protein n=1 Tax=Anaerococcus prevotii TaxID=33034 RepID=UPI002904A8C9|nr:hypothetical protein [Anaerococcus prevotii]